ncbi:MAG: M48 family metalloprotease [Saprospiraceae bacterium]|nr:M48 family metalloprotease [Bacteroidia bacterium]NNE14787.1 M48 family metalloprotease [Saprospiraceae bacterium]NNL92875.1 M48 family metalloprotease [Saprospiraceae bacterium]
MKLSFKNSLFYLIAILLLTSCARNPVTGSKEFMLMSEGQEKALGQQSDPAIIQQYGLYDDAEMQAFINEKGKAMGAISHRPDLDYQFRILDSPVVNAFAVPGGYVYFTRGIMAHFNNEAEFAGVLGHEIGHITARHSAKQYSAQMIGQLGLFAGIIASEDFAQFANQASQGLGLLFLKFGRDHESQSDELGVVYSTTIGYDSHEMADFFKTLNRLQGEAGVSIPDFLSTHPNPVNRYEKVHEMSDVAQKVVDKSNLKVNRNEYLNMIDGIVYGEDPMQGYTLGNMFYHPELLFQFPYPNGWQLVNSPSQIQIVPEDGKALLLMTLSAESNLDAAAQASIEQFKLTVVESRRTTINGFNAIAVVADQTPTDQSGQQTGEPIRLLSYYIQYDNLIYIFHGIAAKNDFNRYINTFEQTMGNFRKLTDQSKIDVTATRIKVLPVKRSGTLQNALTDLGSTQADLNELAIVNGMELGDQVSAGMLLKTFSQEHNRPERAGTNSGSTTNNNQPTNTQTETGSQPKKEPQGSESKTTSGEAGRLGKISKPSTTSGTKTKTKKKKGN